MGEFGDILLEILSYLLFIILNIDLHLNIYNKAGMIKKKYEVLLVSFLIIIFDFTLWGNISEYVIVYLLLLTFSYINICIVFKKNFSKLFYIVLFILLSVFYVLWITVLFGKYYYDNCLIDVSIYQYQIDDIIDKYGESFYTIYDFHLSKVFFSIALEKYFIIPQPISLSNLQFIQFLVGLIIGGTIIESLFDIIKGSILPALPRKSQTENNHYQICDIKLYSIGINTIETNIFYKLLNSNFKLEFSILNNFYQPQTANVHFYIYDNKDTKVYSDKDNKEIESNSNVLFSFRIDENVFSEMKNGKHKIIIWVNDKKMKKVYFYVREK